MKKENDRPEEGIVPPNPRELRDIALYLEGIKKGQGNLLPLGESHLENLWRTIKELQNRGL